MDGGTWQATVHGVSKSWTWLSNVTFFLKVGKVIILHKLPLHKSLLSVLGLYHESLPETVLWSRYWSKNYLSLASFHPLFFDSSVHFVLLDSQTTNESGIISIINSSNGISLKVSLSLQRYLSREKVVSSRSGGTAIWMNQRFSYSIKESSGNNVVLASTSSL